MADGSVIIDTKLDQSGLKTGLASMAGTITSGITSAITAASTALVALGTAVIKTGSEYEAQLSRVQAISGATSEEIAKLDDQAKQLGADTVCKRDYGRYAGSSRPCGCIWW